MLSCCVGLGVIKLEFILRLKIKRNDWLPIIALYFESEAVLKFYNLEAWSVIHYQLDFEWQSGCGFDTSIV